MKRIQFIGSREKSDLVLYVGHLLANLGNRVIIVDATSNDEYKYSYLDKNEIDVICDFQNVEIMKDAKTYEVFNTKLQKAKEVEKDFAYILVDANDSTHFEHWPTFDKTIYVSDTNRKTIMKDTEIINEFIDRTMEKSLLRVHIELPYFVDEAYLPYLLEGRVDFVPISETLEWTDEDLLRKQQMQFQKVIPYSKLSKEHKAFAQDIAIQISNSSNTEIKIATKAVNKGLLKRFKTQSLMPNKNSKDMKEVK